jgi:hypothetical protein
MNLSVAAAMLVFLVNPTSQWAGDKVVNYKMAELAELPEVQEASYTSWERFTEGEDVLRVSGFRMVHELVELETRQIDAPLFADWVKIGFGRADIPNRQMIWTFDGLEADYLDERNGTILEASVTHLTYQGDPFEFEPQENADLAELYAVVAERFAQGDLGDMQIRLLDRGGHLELGIGWTLNDGFALHFQVFADISYREFRRQGYEAEFWSSHVKKPVLVSMGRSGEGQASRQFDIDWAARPEVFEPLIELVLREVPNTLDSIKG